MYLKLEQTKNKLITYIQLDIFIFACNLNQMSFKHLLNNVILTTMFLKQLGLLILLYIIVLGGVMLYLDLSTHHGEKIAVPNVVGKNASDIDDIIDECGLDYLIVDSVYRPEMQEGLILKQYPEPTSKSRVFVKSTRLLEISVSKKVRFVNVPDLRRLSKRYAECILKNRGLKFDFTYKLSPNEIDAVISQKFNGRIIREGDKVPYGSVIYLVIGKKSDASPFQVPDLYGLRLSEVDSLIYDLPSVSIIVGDCKGCMTRQDTLSARVAMQTPAFFKGNLRSPGSDIVIYLERFFKRDPDYGKDEE